MNLWMTPDATRFFLVPDDAAWTVGSFTTHDILGAARAADEAWIRSFEVSTSEAMAFSRRRRAEIDAHVDAQIQAREAARQRALQELQAAGANLQHALEDLDIDAARQMIDGLGLDAARLEADPEAASKLFAAFVTTALQRLTPEAEGDRLAPLREVLVEHGHPEAAERLDKAAADLLAWISQLSE